jgi:hypothetical protein
LEAETVIDHREPARRQRDALPLDAGDMLALGRGMVSEPGVLRELWSSLRQLAPAQKLPVSQVAPDAVAWSSTVKSERVASDRRRRPFASSYARASTIAPGLASPSSVSVS